MLMKNILQHVWVNSKKLLSQKKKKAFKVKVCKAKIAQKEIRYHLIRMILNDIV